ncbi:penicillin-binding transpeptidase domain-containing protein [Enterococcus sp. AZ109]|uniref:penicillin-binding transpeptidase domain-containing protein n=1 Tax=Enterococcus sp. AZ109 TaxID=2774634 RepID=UPI003F228F2B
MKKIKKFLREKNSSSNENRRRVGLLMIGCTIIVFLACAVRISYVILAGRVAGVSLAERIETLYNGSETLIANRGEIFDRNGRPLVINGQQFDMIAVLSPSYTDGGEPRYLSQDNFSRAATILSNHIDSTSEEILAMLEEGITDDGDVLFQVELGNAGKSLSQEQRNAIEEALAAENIQGIHFNPTNNRTYVNGSMAAHLLGYTTTQDGKVIGGGGLEQAYNEILQGTDGQITYERNAQGNPVPGTIATTRPLVHGTDLRTTLSEPLQMQLETLLSRADDAAQAENITGVVMKADTGEILAMAQRPTFNPETMEGTEADNFVWRNLFVEEQYEPGSTMKIGTVATAIDNGSFDAEEVIPAGRIEVNGTVINDHDRGQKGPLTMRQAFSWSSNVGMVELYNKMGSDRWRQAIGRFGIDETTDAGLPGEVVGSLPDNNIVDLAMSTYGQAVSVNQLQMLRMFSAIANEGIPVQPRVVADEENTQENERMFSARASRQVLDYMRDVVEDEEYGTAYDLYRLEGENVSAKTGTAQIAAEDGSGYLRGANDYIYSVALIYPSDEPEYILYLTMKRPQNYSPTILPNIANPIMARTIQQGE